MGRDQPPRARNRLHGVSTHAPAWGATRASQILSQILSSFNPRARMGRDQRHRRLKSIKQCFNPRARMGRDLDMEAFAVSRIVSTHAPAWGATTQPYINTPLYTFQPTRPHGARPNSTTASGL